MSDTGKLQSFIERYESGRVPWDDPLPPPEVVSLVSQLDPGMALDLGSGLGRTSIYLASIGWQVDGVEFVPDAVEQSKKRALAAGVSELVRFHVGDVTNMQFLQGPYDLAIDIGCMHTLESPGLESYRDELLRLLRQHAVFLLFVHLRDDETDAEGVPRWIDQETLLSCFSEGFILDDVTHGITKVADNPPWSSAWYRFRRLLDNSE